MEISHSCAVSYILKGQRKMYFAQNYKQALSFKSAIETIGAINVYII